jgi:hypothetical protein
VVIVASAKFQEGGMNAPLNHNGGPELASKQEFLLASMRVASLNLKSWAAEIDCIGVALLNNQISIEAACEDLHAMGVLRYLPEQVQA